MKIKTLILLAALNTSCTTQQQHFFWSKSGEAADKDAYQDEMHRIEYQNLLDNQQEPGL